MISSPIGLKPLFTLTPEQMQFRFCYNFGIIWIFAVLMMIAVPPNYL